MNFDHLERDREWWKWAPVPPNTEFGNPAASIHFCHSTMVLRFGGSSPMCGRLSFGKCKLKSYKAGRCGHVFDLLVRHD
jgi:hypothetical protein